MSREEQYLLWFFKGPIKEHQWCYSARELNEMLTKLCVGKSIVAIYVSAMNYVSCISTQHRYVDYYMDAALVIRLNDVCIYLLVYAQGLFKVCVYSSSEVEWIQITDCVYDKENEFSDIADVYGMFDLEYKESEIVQVIVDKSSDWSFSVEGFEKSKIGKTIELPERIHLILDNGNKLSITGVEEYFTISICEGENG